jgi:hypothetical protein
MPWADWLISRSMIENLVDSTNNERLSAPQLDTVVPYGVSCAVGGTFDA